jgi:hypothetical protein
MPLFNFEYVTRFESLPHTIIPTPNIFYLGVLRVLSG